MEKVEFANCMAYLATATGKPITAEQTDVYFDLLGDLPLGVLQIAVKRVALAHKWATFPSAAEIREAAAETAQGKVNEMSAGEAWSLAWRAACSIDPGNEANYLRDGVLYDSQAHWAMETLPARVAEAVRGFGGIKLLANSEGNYARREFVRVYDDLVRRDERVALLPAPLKQAIAQAGKPALPEARRQLIEDIGKMP